MISEIGFISYMLVSRTWQEGYIRELKEILLGDFILEDRQIDRWLNDQSHKQEAMVWHWSRESMIAWDVGPTLTRVLYAD